MKKLICLLPLAAALLVVTGCEEEDKKASPIVSPIGLFEFTTMTDNDGPVAYPAHIQENGEDYWLRSFIEITESRVRLYYIAYDSADGSPEGVGYSTGEDSTVIEITDTQILTNRNIIHYIIEGSEIKFYSVTNGDNELDSVIEAKAGNPEDITGAVQWYSIRTKNLGGL